MNGELRVQAQVKDVQELRAQPTTIPWPLHLPRGTIGVCTSLLTVHDLSEHVKAEHRGVYQGAKWDRNSGPQGADLLT